MVMGVRREGDAELVQVRQTSRAPRSLSGSRERRQEQCGEDGDDGDHDQKLDQGEGVVHRPEAAAPCAETHKWNSTLMPGTMALCARSGNGQMPTYGVPEHGEASPSAEEHRPIRRIQVLSHLADGLPDHSSVQQANVRASRADGLDWPATNRAIEGVA